MEEQFEVERDGGVLRLAGEFDLNSCDSLREELSKALADSAGSGVVVDLSKATFLDSEALNALLSGFTAAQDADIGFRLTGATGVVRRVLEISGVADLDSGGPR